MLSCLFFGGKGNNVLRLLETLLSAKIEPEEKKQILQNEFDIKMTQAFDKEVTDMCNLSKGIIEESLAEGMEKGIVIAIRKMMDKLKMTAEQAMDTMNISKDERSKYEELLKQTAPKA